MNRLAALFEHLSLPELSRVLRRTALCALAVGIVALVVSLVLNHLFVGLGAATGLALGLLNVRLIARAVARVAEVGPAGARRALASRTLARLGVTTVVIVGLLLASLQLGFGAAGGVAVFYFLLLVNLLRAILRQGGARVVV